MTCPSGTGLTRSHVTVLTRRGSAVFAVSVCVSPSGGVWGLRPSSVSRHMRVGALEGWERPRWRCSWGQC